MREMRALCVHQFEYILSGEFNPANIDLMIEEAVESNFNTLQVCMKAPGILYYLSKYGPAHEYCRTYDLLGDVVAKGHAAGLEVHSYFPMFLDGGWDGKARDVNGGMFAKHPEWRQMHFVEGRLQPTCYPCPSNEEYVEYLTRLTEEQCEDYELDAVCLDFIRFGGRCYCASCQEGFRNFPFKTFADKELQPGNLSPDEAEYRCRQVEEVVKHIAGVIRESGRRIKVGAYVFWNPRVAIPIVFQDWVGFSEYLDFVLPMFYQEPPVEEFAEVVAHQRRLVGRPLIAGIMTSAKTARGMGSAEAICSYIEAVRAAGCEGFFILQYETLFGKPMGIYSGEKWGSPQPPETLREVRARFLQEPAEPLFRGRSA